MAAPFQALPEDIAKVDALVSWLDAAEPISTEEAKALRAACQKSMDIDWIGLHKADLTLEQAVADERTDLVGERRLIALRDRPSAEVNLESLEDINTTPWPIPDLYASDQDEFKQNLREVDQDLGIQCDFVRTFFSRHWQIGIIGITYYVWRVAVILRKAKELERELRFLRACCRHRAANVCLEGREQKLAARLRKKGLVV